MTSTRSLGPTDIVVSSIGLGGMPMSIKGRPSESDSVQVLHSAFDAGINFVDTADVYCLDDSDLGHNERLVAKALGEWSGDPIFVATKGGLERPDGAWVTNGHPSHLTRACERSLKALGLDVIDLYQLHAPDPDVPFAESVGALKQLKEQGKVRHVGLSNVSRAQIEEASAILDIVSVQNRLHPRAPGAFKNGVLDYCDEKGIAFLPYSPVGGGRDRKSLAKDKALVAIGEEIGHSPQEVALAWLLTKSPNMIPIPGASRVESARSSAKAMAIELSEDVCGRLDRAFLGDSGR